MIFRDRNLTLKQTASLLAFDVALGTIGYLLIGRLIPVCTFAGIFCIVWLARNLILQYVDGVDGLREDADERTKSIAHQAAHSAFWVLISVAFVLVWGPNDLLGYVDSFSLLTILYSLGLVVYVFTEVRLRMKA